MATIVQTAYGTSTDSTASVHFATDPTVGNLLVAWLFGIFDSLNTPDWTLLEKSDNGAFPDVFMAYRYVQGGDDNNFGSDVEYDPNIGSGTTGYLVMAAMELGDVTGVIADDIVATAMHKEGISSSGSLTFPVNTDSNSAVLLTTEDNQTAVICVMVQNQNSSQNTIAGYDVLEADFNLASYGVGLALSKLDVPTSGTDIAAVCDWSTSGVQTMHCFALILGAPIPPAPPSIVQYKHGLQAFSGNIQPTLDSAPTEGNILVASVGTFFIGTFNSTDWTLLDSEAADGGSYEAFTCYRYVGASESATLPIIQTGGFASDWFVYEVDNVTGDAGTDIIAHDHVDASPPNPGSDWTSTLPDMGPTADGQLALIFFSCESGTDSPDLSSPYTEDLQVPIGSNFQSAVYGHASFNVGEDTSVTVTFDNGGGSSGAALMGVLIGPGVTPAEDSNSNSGSTSGGTPPTARRSMVIVL